MRRRTDCISDGISLQGSNHHRDSSRIHYFMAVRNRTLIHDANTDAKLLVAILLSPISPTMMPQASRDSSFSEESLIFIQSDLFSQLRTGTFQQVVDTSH